MDRGYTDYAWYKSLNNNGISFVTRLKTNARCRVIERRTVPKNKGLTRDQTIEFTGARAKNCPIRLRRIGDKDAHTGIQYTFLTSHFKLAARTIADIYKARWQVELFFKMDQAKPEGEKLPWRLKKCRIDPNRDRHVHVSAAQLHQVLTKDTAQPSADTSTLANQLV